MSSQNGPTNISALGYELEVHHITICFVMANFLTWMIQVCWVVVVWKYLNSKSLERQTMMDLQIKVNMVAWLLVILSLDSISALVLLGVRCHPTVALVVTLTTQASFLWLSFLFVWSSIMKYIMVKHAGLLDDCYEHLLATTNIFVFWLVTTEMIIMQVAFEGELPPVFYILQGIHGKGNVSSVVIGGQFAVLKTLFHSLFKGSVHKMHPTTRCKTKYHPQA